ncbi:MAG: DsrE family protein [Halothiobacillaceae bacterium]|nr:DsrE family protein [Halothiobacillaceae bacterium]
MKKLMCVVTGVVWLSASLLAQAADMAKVVYHVDFNDVTRYSATLTSVNNLLNAYEQELRDYEVHLVFVGHGMRFVTDDALKGTPYAEDRSLAERRAELKGRLEALRKVRNVKVELCDKTRDEIAFPKEKLYEGVTLVGSGVAHIADLQQAGFAYLKVQ